MQENTPLLDLPIVRSVMQGNIQRKVPQHVQIARQEATHQQV
jgi:hypothetical protein